MNGKWKNRKDFSSIYIIYVEKDKKDKKDINRRNFYGCYAMVTFA